MTSFFEWQFVAEVEVSPNEWRVVDTFGTKEEATKRVEDTSEKRKTRVRQFKVAVFRDEVVKPIVVEPSENKLPLISFYCFVHPDRKAQGLTVSRPRCPDCRQEMFREKVVPPIVLGVAIPEPTNE